MKTIINPNRSSWSSLVKRPSQSLEELEPLIKKIFENVRVKGDAAVLEYTKAFDGVDLNEIRVSSEEIRSAGAGLSDDLKGAMQLAKQNIEVFHKAQQADDVLIETMKGVSCWRKSRPIERVGLYIPGGTAPLFSTILMLAVPAKLAGCKSIFICTPPDKDGSIRQEILYAARICGIAEVFRVGGAQAIAAMALGTESITKAYKIFGPGNQYVTMAKQLALVNGVAIDMPAGPSELLVVADESAKPAYVAADLLSQAEHGEDSQVILIADSEKLAKQVNAEIEDQLKKLPRKAIAEKSLANSKCVILKDRREALDLINLYGPEHLIICKQDAEYYIDGIQNAGSVFIGNYSPESAGDYASGTNHTLPTNGATYAFSGVSLESFQKWITFQELSKEGLKNIGPAIELMAEAEGLQGHKNAVSIRLKN